MWVLGFKRLSSELAAWYCEHRNEAPVYMEREPFFFLPAK